MVASLWPWVFLLLSVVCTNGWGLYRCHCNDGEWNWPKGDPGDQEKYLFAQFGANGFGRAQDGHLLWVTSLLIPGDTYDYDHIADWHDACYDVCGADPYHCDEKFVEMVQDYCLCVINPSATWRCKWMVHTILNLLAFGSKERCNLPHVIDVFAGSDDKAKKKMTTFMKCQNDACECIPANKEGQDKILGYLKKMRAKLHSTVEAKYPLPDLEGSKNPDKSSVARQWIFSVLENTRARKMLIQGHAKNMYSVRDRAKPPNVLRRRKLDLHKDVLKDPIKKAKCKASLAMKDGFMVDQTQSANVYFDDWNRKFTFAMETLIIENILIILLLSLFGLVCGFVSVKHFVNNFISPAQDKAIPL